MYNGYVPPFDRALGSMRSVAGTRSNSGATGDRRPATGDRAWRSAAGRKPQGWQWVGELDARGADATTVRLTHDRSGVTDDELKEQIGFTLRTEDLATTLDRLAQAVAT